METHTLLILAREQDVYAEKLRALRLPELHIEVAGVPARVREAIHEADILLAEPASAKQYLSEASRLKWLQTTTIGIDALMDGAVRRDYILTNARGILGPKLAEYTFAHILAYKKRVFENRELQHQKKWESKPTTSLVGQTIVLLGTGSIGAHIAKVAKAFGMRTCGYRTKKEPVEFFDEIFGLHELSEALSKGDYVVSALPSTKDTNEIIRRETISHMKDGVVFINIGRGNAVAENDLLEAVKSGKIARAILDVFHEEPLPHDHPLWTAENVVVTPHMAGYAGLEGIVDLFAENYRRFARGENLLYTVDFEKGY